MRLDAQHALLRRLPTPQAMLSTHIFAGHRRSAVRDVWVSGQLRVHEGVHASNAESSSAFAAARQDLLSATS